MDAEALGPALAALQRARLHWRGGTRRLRQGKIAPGLAALYDALTSAMDWYYAAPERRARVTAQELRDEGLEYAALVRSGVLDGGLDFAAFHREVHRLLDDELAPCDPAPLLAGVESALTQLGVLPFDEGTLPPEDPATL
jgi:hypothetical protein